MTSPTSSPSVTSPALAPDSSALQPCSPSCCYGNCQSAPATTAITAAPSVSNDATNKSDFSASTPSESGYAIQRTLLVHRDNRGNVRETFRASWFPQVPPIRQLVRSKSKPKTLRGMHFHKRQWDIWHIVKGAALVRTYNHETGENDFGWFGPGQTLAIPPRLSHGFYTPDGCILLYGLTEEWDGSDEFGWYFADGLQSPHPPEFQEEWPISPEGLNISDRDGQAVNLSFFAE